MQDIYYNSDAILDFYRNGGVDIIIKKYPLSDDEKEILFRAQRTAKRDKPNMELIKRADNLLSIVTKIRQPLEQESIDPKDIADAILFAEQIDKQSKEIAENAGKKKKMVRIVMFIIMSLLGLLINYILIKKSDQMSFNLPF